MSAIKYRYISTIALAVCVSFAPIASSQNLGNYGNQWEIEEEDGVEQMINKLKEMKKNGKLDELQNKYRDDYLFSLENPEPVPGINTAKETKTYWLDPSIVVPEDVVDDQGQVLLYAGTFINPLQYAPWSKSVVLIDGRDKAQVEFAFSRLEKHPNDKVILVAGSYLELMREREQRIYYDVGGAFTTRFGVKTVPAVISQDGDQLKVNQMALQDYATIKTLNENLDEGDYGY